jgi:cell division protein FtsL
VEDTILLAVTERKRAMAISLQKTFLLIVLVIALAMALIGGIVASQMMHQNHAIHSSIQASISGDSISGD